MLSLTLIMIAATVAVQPTDDLPLIDDWVYAWSVDHFLKTGQLRVLDWSAHYPLAQIVWGALFARVFGFSFFVLRVSTLVLEWIGLLAFFCTLRAVGVGPSGSALGTLGLLFNPVMFVLAHSYMTDVPFVSAMNVATLWYVLWATRRRSVYLAVGSVFAIGAFLIRQIGALLGLAPVAYLVLLWIFRGRRRVPWRDVLLLSSPFVAIALMQWWIRDIHGMTDVYRWKAEALYQSFLPAAWLSSRSWWIYFRIFARTLVYLGVLLWPLALPSTGARSRRVLLWSALFVFMVTVAYGWQSGRMPRLLQYGETLSLEELGASRALISREELSRPIPGGSVWVLLGLALTSAAAILAVLWERARNAPGWSSPVAVVWMNGLLQFIAIEVLWFDFDRYYLPLLPALTALLLVGTKWTRVTRGLVVAGVLIFGAVSVSGTIDEFRFNRAVAQAREWLLERGVPPWQIDAGYVLNGWWLYAHPENLPPGAHPEWDVPFVTSATELPYKIANSPLPAYSVMKTFAWRSLWAVSDRVYVLQRIDVVPRLTATLRSAPAGGDPGVADIRWRTGDGSIGQVYVSEDGGQERLLARGAEGGREVRWIRPGAVYEFRLYPVTDRNRVLARVTVTSRSE